MLAIEFPFCNLSNLHVQIAEPAVAQYCKEAEQLLLESRYVDLATLLLTSADLVLANASEKGMSPSYKSQICVTNDLIMFKSWNFRKVMSEMRMKCAPKVNGCSTCTPGPRPELERHSLWQRSSFGGAQLSIREFQFLSCSHAEWNRQALSEVHIMVTPKRDLKHSFWDLTPPSTVNCSTQNFSCKIFGSSILVKHYALFCSKFKF